MFPDVLAPGKAPPVLNQGIRRRRAILNIMDRARQLDQPGIQVNCLTIVAFQLSVLAQVQVGRRMQAPPIPALIQGGVRNEPPDLPRTQWACSVV